MQAKSKLNIIQALRGIAAILVVCYHTGTLFSVNLNQVILGNIFKAGHTGVTFFFVLSGFIIFYIHHRDLGNSDCLKTFLYKRATRILPIYWVVLLFKLITKQSDIISLIFAFFLIPVADPFIKVSWTLSFEIFFYFIFGLMILNFGKLSKSVIAIYIILIFLAFLLQGIYKPFTDDYFYFSFLFNSYILEFLLGICAAYIVINNRGKNYRNIMYYGGIILFFVSFTSTILMVNQVASETNAEPYWRAELLSCFLEDFHSLFFGIPSMLMIIGAAFKDKYDNIKVPEILLKAGDASYSIYLIHAILINILTVKLASVKLTNLNYTILPVILSAIIAGYIFHIFIEKPMLGFFQKYYNRNKNSIFKLSSK